MAALPQEARVLKRLQGTRNSPSAAGGRFVLAVSGVGARHAGDAARRLLGAGVGALMSWGTAAGLRPGLPPGTLLLPEEVIDSQGAKLSTDPGWHRAVMERLAAQIPLLSTGTLAESPRLLCTADDKQVLLRRTGAVAADMESAAIAVAAREAGVPFLAVRAVADPAHGHVPSCVGRALDREGRVHIARLLACVLVTPSQGMYLFCLARWFRAARHALCRASDHGLIPPAGLT